MCQLINALMSGYMRTIRVSHCSLSLYGIANGAKILAGRGIGVIECINILTYYEMCVIDLFMTIPAKKKALLASGTLNLHPEAVRSQLFKMDFFDRCDRAQVKYEMLRSHAVDGDPVAAACRQFGFSRQSFYQIQRAFSEFGFSSFLPGKPGRKGPVKLKGEMLAFALEKQKENPDIDPAQLAALIQERFGIEIHRTTVMRGMKKKRRSPAEIPAGGIQRRRRPDTGDL
jgi:transposase